MYIFSNVLIEHFIPELQLIWKKELENTNSSELGAKYTRGRRPVKLVFSKEFESRSEASKEEARIKKSSRQEKLDLIRDLV